MDQLLRRVYVVDRIISENDANTQRVSIKVSDDNGNIVEQSFIKPAGDFWDYECARNERMAVKLLIHNLLMK